ncbi:trehalose-phosphatase [Pseudoxanthomonas beigongshangi]
MESESTLAAEPPLIEDDWALFLDVDGSLAEHAPTPDAVLIDPAIKQALPALSRKCGGALALVSGRTVAALDALFAPTAIATAAGLHGLERRSHAGWEPAPAMDAPFLALATEAEAIARRYPGALVECRGGCLFLHWRAAPEAASELGAFADRIRQRLPRHRLHPGAHGIEIRPLGMDKGEAIAAFMADPPFQGRRPAFIGDDPADEPGFAQVNARGGISVLVGATRPSMARYRLANPGDVRRWLLDSLQGEVMA